MFLVNNKFKIFLVLDAYYSAHSPYFLKTCLEAFLAARNASIWRAI